MIDQQLTPSSPPSLLEIVYHFKTVVNTNYIEVYLCSHSVSAGLFAVFIITILWKRINLKQVKLIDERTVPSAYALMLSGIPENFDTLDFLRQTARSDEEQYVNLDGVIQSEVECSGIYQMYKLAKKHLDLQKKKIIDEYKGKDLSKNITE